MSLLLDALKKAAEEKLQKQQDGTVTDNSDTTYVTQTDATEIGNTEVEASTQMDSTEMDSDAIQADTTEIGNTEVEALDATEVGDTEVEKLDATASDTDITEAGNIQTDVVETVDEDLTTFDIEPVDATDNNPFKTAQRDTTEIGDTKLNADPTEVEELTASRTDAISAAEDNTHTQQQSTRTGLRAELEALGSDTTVIGDASIDSIDLDQTGIDVTQSVIDQVYADGSRSESETQAQKTSMTENMLLRGYQPSPQKASDLFSLKTDQENSRTRIFLLMVLVMLVGCGVAGLYAYDYFVVSKQQDFNFSYKRLPRPGQQVAATDTAVDRATDDVGIVVAQEDYVALLDEEFDALENVKPDEPPVEPVKPKPAAKSTKTASSKKTIKIRKKSRREPLQDIVLRGYEAFNAGDFATAQAAYQEAARRQPRNRDVQLGLAALAIQQGNVDEARTIYANLLNQNPSDPAALAGIAALGPVNADETAASVFKLMLEQQPEAPHLYFALGNTYAEQQRWPEAQQAFFEAYRRDDQNADYAYNLAVSLDHLGKQSAALNFYQQALVLAAIKTSSVPAAATEQRIATLTSQPKQ